MNALQTEIMQNVPTHKPFTAAYVAHCFNVSSAEMRKELNQLVKMGKLRRTTPNEGKGYMVA